MTMNRTTAWICWAPQLLTVSLLLTAVTSVHARQANDEVTPEVQKLFAQAKAVSQNGDSAEAINKYLAAIKLAPHLAPAYNNLGMLYLKEHDYAHAVEVLKRALGNL